MTYRSQILLLLVCLITGCSRSNGDGLQKYQVTGTVMVNGAPLERVIVTLNSVDPAANPARPVGHTNADGEFKLSTNGDADGAVAGEYIVTFMRSDADFESPDDHFHNTFTNPATSKFRVKVLEEETILKPFDLQVPPEWIRDAEKSDMRAESRG